MDAIGPGDFVECIALCPYVTGEAPADAALPIPQLGGVYKIVAIIPESVYSDGCGDGLVLHEFPYIYTTGDRMSFEASAFRPIYRRDESLIQRLQQPIKETLNV